MTSLKSPLSLTALAAMMAAALAGLYVGNVGVTYREAIIFVLGVCSFGLAIAGEIGITGGFIALICSLGLGYRTIELTPFIGIIPAEVIIWGLCVWILVRSLILQQGKVEFWLPTWIWLSIPFWIWAWRPILDNTNPWDEKLNEFRDFLLLIPLTLVANRIFRDPKNWMRVCYAYYGVAVFIAVMGLIEYVFPGVGAMSGGFIQHAEGFVAEGGFRRANFSFWGSPTATFTCALALPLVLLVWHEQQSVRGRIGTITSACLLLTGIYIGGFRSMWLLVTAIIPLYSLLSRKYYVAIVLLALGVLGYSFLPETTQGRIGSLGLILQGKPVDSSGIKRMHRVVDAYHIVEEHPEGMGWANAGWVHNDFIQVAANQGVLAFCVLAAGCLTAIGRLGVCAWREARGAPRRRYALPFLLILIVVVGIMFFEGVEVLPQQVLPIWCLWIMIEIWLRHNTSIKLLKMNPENVSGAAVMERLP